MTLNEVYERLGYCSSALVELCIRSLTHTHAPSYFLVSETHNTVCSIMKARFNCAEGQNMFPRISEITSLNLIFWH
jgi:hypothetical protein